MAEKHDDATINAYMKKYGERVYDPTANAEALAAKNAAVARRARLAGMLSASPVVDGPCA